MTGCRRVGVYSAVPEARAAGGKGDGIRNAVDCVTERECQFMEPVTDLGAKKLILLTAT